MPTQPPQKVEVPYFVYGGDRVFLSGMNQAWGDYMYGNDFGNGQYACCSGQLLEEYLSRISSAGGNSVSELARKLK